MPQLSVPPLAPQGARRPGSRLAWIGQAFLGILSLITVAILAKDLVSDPKLFIQIILSGLQLGFVYALIALGYRSISMAPAAIGPVKAMVLSANAQKLNKAVLELVDSNCRNIRRELSDYAQRENIDI